MLRNPPRLWSRTRWSFQGPDVFYLWDHCPKILLCVSSDPRRLFLLISQERNISAAMERRCFALLSAFSTAMLILSNLVFLGGTHVARIFWNRVFIQGKLPPITHTWEGTVVFFWKCFSRLSAGFIHLCPVRATVLISCLVRRLNGSMSS